MLLFVAFGSRSVENLKDRAKSRTTTEECLDRQRSSVTSFLLHLIWLRNSRSGFKARLQQV